MPFFIHSTDVVNLILQSGEFRGTNKEMAKLGMSRDDALALEAAGKATFHTLFATPADTRESVIRIKNRSGRNVRGVLVFSNEKGTIVEGQGYPSAAGATVSLSDMDLRLVLLEREDCIHEGWTCCCKSTQRSVAYQQLLVKTEEMGVPTILAAGLRDLTVLEMDHYIAGLAPAGLAPQPQQMV